MSDSVENIQRKMILLEIEKNEKSSFDDVITGAESDNGWEDCLKETEYSVTSQWISESDNTVSSQTIQESSEGPISYYELDDLNHKPIGNNSRMARVPSQYQLDALSEMFIFDLPQHIAMQRMENACDPVVLNSIDQEAVNRGTTPCFINSEYVSEMI
ncbi:hypothetical protein CRE_02297 [Caenorhabditis remanei]|nr:hypothetical protein CRE_02297 [Caenorhabditis remanei]